MKKGESIGWNISIDSPLSKRPKYLKDYGDYTRGEILKLTTRKKQAQIFKQIVQAEIAVKVLSAKFKDGIVKIIRK